MWKRSIIVLFVFVFVMENCESSKRRWTVKFEALSNVRLVDNGGE